MAAGWGKEQYGLSRERVGEQAQLRYRLNGRSRGSIHPSARSQGAYLQVADRFDKFSSQARHVLQLAQEETQRYNHNYIGTEHVLLGLIRVQEGAAVQVLAQLGVELNTVRQRVEFIIGRGDRTVAGNIGLTPRAKKVIELAVDSARRLNHHFVGPEHLLLGLVREGEGIAAGVLESLGISMERAWTTTLDVLAIPPDQRLAPVPRSHLPESTVNDLRQGLAGGRAYSPTMPSLTTGANLALEEAQLTARWLRHRELGTGVSGKIWSGWNGGFRQRYLRTKWRWRP